MQGLRATAVFYDDAEPAAADVPAVDADVEAGELIAAQLPPVLMITMPADGSQVGTYDRIMTGT